MHASTDAQKVVGAGSQEEGGKWVEQLVSVTAGCRFSDAVRTHILPQQLDVESSFHLSVTILLTCIE